MQHLKSQNSSLGNQGEALVNILPPEQIVIDTKQASVRGNISESFLEKQRARGEGPPYIKIGNRVRYLVPEFDAWVRSLLVTTNADVTS